MTIVLTMRVSMAMAMRVSMGMFMFMAVSMISVTVPMAETTVKQRVAVLMPYKQISPECIYAYINDE